MASEEVIEVSDMSDSSPTTSPAKKRPNPEVENWPHDVKIYSDEALQKLSQMVNGALFGEVPESSISTAVPNHCYERREASFLVDTSSLLCYDDVRVDQMGAYAKASNDMSF